ncbi:purine nucleoside phosphorylase 5a [Echinococcus granulosus]|uniref:Purine nucleoside phosphorylase 5a n=1 Tax=Echinococcus granulosus TaxID=6210 RepID=W6V973_ECHGR|nr:purine nucleoside phosphorylase 5a [Echinococcus granulosus]EUB63109.1 purine nucleoside phosphorylase 5a [Echinococcus granulosus]
MSTAYETVVAKHADLKVFAISLIADIAVLDEDTEVPITHEEVLRTAGKRAECRDYRGLDVSVGGEGAFPNTNEEQKPQKLHPKTELDIR